MNAGRAFGGTANTAKTMKSAEIQTNVVDLFESHIEPHWMYICTYIYSDARAILFIINIC